MKINMPKNCKIFLSIMPLLLIFIVIIFNQLDKPEIQAHKIFGSKINSETELKSIGRANAPFDFLFLEVASSSFNFDINMGKQEKNIPLSLWIYASQANNHGELSIKYNGEEIGVVDNRLIEITNEPIPKLSYVGEIKPKNGDIVLSITSRNETLSHHYAELGLLILSPVGVSEQEVLNSLNGNLSIAFGGILDVGLLFILLAAAYGALTTLKNNKKDNALAIVVLLCLMGLFLFSILTVNSRIVLEKGTNARTGIEAVVDSGFKDITSKINRWQKTILPDRQHNDDVPLRFQGSSGHFETKIYRTEKNMEFNQISTTLLGGTLSDVQAMSRKGFRNVLLAITIGIFIGMAFDRFKRSKLPMLFTMTLISALSIFMSLRLSDGWDEFFINLRHSYMLFYHGVYSINQSNLIEGTVDTIPLLVTTLLAITGLNLIDAFIIISLLGNIVVIIFSYLIVKAVTHQNTWALFSAFLIGVYPNVVWIGGTGFSAVLFSGWILAASYYILFTQKRLLGLILLSLLTLVRTEGILFAFLLMGYVYVLEPLPAIIRTGQWKMAIKRAFVDGLIVAAPFLLSLVVRQAVYGHPIPNPILFKSTGFDTGFIASGLGRFTEMISIHELHLMALMIFFLYIALLIICRTGDEQIKFKKSVNRLLMLNAVAFCFILPYYTGGGDWFPARWNRYGLPFNLCMMLSLLVLMYGIFYFGLKSWIRSTALITFTMLLFVGYVGTKHSPRDNNFYDTLRALRHPNEHQWKRIDSLASLGSFLRDTLPSRAIVSSPEEATIMYYSERDMLGLLGVSNPDMTGMPLQPLSSGDILHRKRGYEAIYKYRPDVIAFYEPVVRGDFSEQVDLKEKIHQALQDAAFNPGMVNVIYYRAGSFDALEKMGYRHVTISFPDRAFSFFVNENVYDEFIENIENRGFMYLGSGLINYSVDGGITKKYKPASEKIMEIL